MLVSRIRVKEQEVLVVNIKYKWNGKEIMKSDC
jgi:hypothetical protein